MSNQTTAMKTTITTAERRAITQGILNSNVLRGNDRTKTKGQALAVINSILKECGFYLNLVPGDIIMGDHGQRQLSFTREGAEDQSIENASINFVWENLTGTKYSSHKIWEFLAYVA